MKKKSENQLQFKKTSAASTRATFLLFCRLGRWYAHEYADRQTDMPRHAVGRKRYQMMPNDTKIKTILEVKKLGQNGPKCTKKWHQMTLNDTKKNCTKLHQIALKKLFVLPLYLILPSVSFMCCVARGLL